MVRNVLSTWLLMSKIILKKKHIATMVLSYSAVAQPTSDTPAVISIASPVASSSTARPVSPATSTVGTATASTSTASSSTHHLILDAGPLLSLTPLRHLAQSFHTTPLVLAELRDPKAREHWERLGLSGVNVKVETPTPEAMAKVIEFAKKTGDFAVLSKTDLSVIALTYQYEIEVNGNANIRTELGQRRHPLAPRPISDSGEMLGERETESARLSDAEEGESGHLDGQDEPELIEEVSRSIEQVLLDQEDPPEDVLHAETTFSEPLAAQYGQVSPTGDAGSLLLDNEPPASDADDGEGDWITPTNVTTHRSHDLGLVPEDASSKAADMTPLAAACMTGDFAVQNVLLGMGLGLVGEGGRRISKVRSWVLRCHACFK